MANNSKEDKSKGEGASAGGMVEAVTQDVELIVDKVMDTAEEAVVAVQERLGMRKPARARAKKPPVKAKAPVLKPKAKAAKARVVKASKGAASKIAKSATSAKGKLSKAAKSAKSSMSSKSSKSSKPAGKKANRRR